mgnify:CR=1 FL=1
MSRGLGDVNKRQENGFVRFFKRVAKFFRDCKGEVKKIVWPTPKATFKSTGVVLVTIIVVALFVFLLDTVFMNLLGLVMDVAG